MWAVVNNGSQQAGDAQGHGPHGLLSRRLSESKVRERSVRGGRFQPVSTSRLFYEMSHCNRIIGGFG